MIRAFKLSPLVLCTTVALLVIGELVSGTPMYFTAMMAITLLSIGVTYNLLGGAATFGGILFASFALRTIVISQFAKVLLFEPADKNLEAPQLTISVYAAFFFCALLGTFIFCRVRLPLPKPLESLTEAQTSVLYISAFLTGLVASLIFEIYLVTAGEQKEYNSMQSVGLAFTPLLLFSMVIAVDARIRRTGGRHSFDLAAFFPWIALAMLGFIDTARRNMILPTVLYLATCYLRGYRFKKRHYAVALMGIVAFSYFIGPLELYTRGFSSGQSFKDRAYWAFHILATHHDPTELRNAAQQAVESGGGATREQYYSRPGTYQLSRFALIRADSNLISACSNGFHYGFTAIRLAFLKSIPTIFYKNKPRYTTVGDYVGGVSGVSGDREGFSFPAMSIISDSYGAFGWMGVILSSFFGFPMAFMVCESIFDMSRPWGTVALGICLVGFTETGLSGLLPFMIRIPASLVLLSYLLGGLIKMLPVKADRAVSWRPELPN